MPKKKKTTKMDELPRGSSKTVNDETVGAELIADGIDQEIEIKIKKDGEYELDTESIFKDPTNEELCAMIQDETHPHHEAAKNRIITKNQALVDKIIAKYQCFYHNGRNAFYNQYIEKTDEDPYDTDKNDEAYEERAVDDVDECVEDADEEALEEDETEEEDSEEPEMSYMEVMKDDSGKPILVRGLFKTRVDPDLEQCGLLAVYIAATKYKKTKGKFTTYASAAVKHAVLNEILANGRIVKIPRSFSDKYVKYYKTFEKYFLEDEGRLDESYKKAAKELSVEESDVREVIETWNRCNTYESINKVTGDEAVGKEMLDNITYDSISTDKKDKSKKTNRIEKNLPEDIDVHNYINDVYRQTAYTLVTSNDLHKTYSDALNNMLGVYEKKVINAIYGFGKIGEHYKSGIAKHFSTNVRNLNGIEQRVLNKLKTSEHKEDLRALLDLYESRYGPKAQYGHKADADGGSKCNKK